MTMIKDFDAASIKSASIQFIKAGVQEEGKLFGCVGSISSETETKELKKTCQGVDLKSTVKPVKMNVEISAHVPVDVARQYFGLTNDGLAKGVYAYGTSSKSGEFVFTAELVDDFTDNVMHIAFPLASNMGGYEFDLSPGGDEIAMVKFKFTAVPDLSGKIYYQAIESDLDKPEIAAQWHTKFSHDLVKVTTPAP